MTATTMTTITIPVDLYNVIRDLAAESEQSENELLAEALRAYKREEMRMKFRSIGAISDPELQARDIDEWLERNWDPDTRS